MAVFFLPQTPVEPLGEEEAPESECPQAGASPQAGPASLLPPAGAEAEVPRRGLRAVEKPQPQSGRSLKQRQAPSRNTIGAVAGKLALRFVSRLLPYGNQLDGPGTPFSDSLLISNEIL